MSDNPYAPPNSRVEDAQATGLPGTRPWQIVLAVRLAAIAYGLGLVGILLSWDYYSKLQSTGSLVLNQLFSVALMVWIYYKIFVGRNWARIVLLVFFLIGTGTMLTSVVMNLLLAAPTIAKVQMVVGVLINLIVLWLLFLSPGRRWFGKTPGGSTA
jgi:hypothetical protein